MSVNFCNTCGSLVTCLLSEVWSQIPHQQETTCRTRKFIFDYSQPVLAKEISSVFKIETTAIYLFSVWSLEPSPKKRVFQSVSIHVKLVHAIQLTSLTLCIPYLCHGVGFRARYAEVDCFTVKFLKVRLRIFMEWHAIFIFATVYRLLTPRSIKCHMLWH